jgi:hypothetical protein
MRKSLIVLVVFWHTILILMTHPLFAQGGANCRTIGGAVLTNFLDQATTLGTATGDLKGGLGVSVLNFSPGQSDTLIFQNRHHWVTETGDTIFFDDASATAYPSGIPGLYAVRYTEGVTLSGGTGRFARASGRLAMFGAVDQNRQQVILRYQGQVCSRPVEPSSTPALH